MPLAPFQLERYLSTYLPQATGELVSACPDSLTLQDLIQLAPDYWQAVQDRPLAYGNSQGGEELRQALVEHIYPTLSPDQISCFNGGSEAIYTWMNTVLTPDRPVIVQWPVYQSLASVANSIGCPIIQWPMVASKTTGWTWDLNWLADHLSPDVQAIVVNFPHNPTGAIMHLSDYHALIHLARQWDVPIVHDEVYRGSEIEVSPLPPMVTTYEHGVSIGDCSKAFGLAGLRIGWVATNYPDQIHRMAPLRDYTTLSNSLVSEWLATIAIQHSTWCFEQFKATRAVNLAILGALIENAPDRLHWHRPVGGFTGWLELKEVTSAADFALTLLNRAGLLTLPSTVFGWGDSHLRIGIGQRRYGPYYGILKEVLLNSVVTKGPTG